MNSFVGKYVALIRQTRVWMTGDLEDTKLYWGVSLGGERLDWLTGEQRKGEVKVFVA